jgi:3-phytase
MLSLRSLICFIPVLLLFGCAEEKLVPPPDFAKSVFASAESTPVTSSGDAADDPAIWVNRENIELSRVIGTDKDYGVEVYSLDGQRVQSIAAGRTNNIDLRMFEVGAPWSAIAAASNRTSNSISLFLIDASGELTWLTDSEIDTGLTEPYGLCMFKNEVGIQIFVNDTDGRYQQWLISEVGQSNGRPQYKGELLREFRVSSQPEGCVADDYHQRLFLGVENEGIRIVDAHHEKPAEVVKLVDIDGDILLADVEGMSLYEADTSGYLIVSSQGNNSYAVYDRLPPHGYRGSFFVADDTQSGIDGSAETDGLAVNSKLRTAQFPEGLLVVQDGFNEMPDEAQNFKFVSWQQVAKALGL